MAKTHSKHARLAEASPVGVGDEVGGKYVVTELLALGGMGLVAAARHDVLDQTVAIKFLLPGLEAPGASERFLREAKAAAAIQSEHVVRVFDCGTLAGDTGEPIPYMVMEHLDGCSLSQEMRRRGAMGIEEAIDLVMQALEGVAEAHARGIVHRDIKPSNLFLVGEPPLRTVKVLDFGISKIPVGADTPVGEEDLTHTAMILGSPRYIAPEQARNSRDVDLTADIWSIGVIVYQLIVGQAPFTGDTIGEILSQILLISPTPLGKVRSDVPPLLTAAVQRCLERDPRDRFQSVAELAEELAPHGSKAAARSLERIVATLGTPGAGASAREVEEPPTWITPSGSSRAKAALTADAERTGATVGTWEHRQQKPTSSRAWLISALVISGAVALGAFGAWRLLRHPMPPAEPAVTTDASALATEVAQPEPTTPPELSVSIPVPTASAVPPRTTRARPALPPPPPSPLPPPTEPKPTGRDPLEHSD